MDGKRVEKNVAMGETLKFKVEKIEVDHHGLLILKGNPNEMTDSNLKRG